MRTNVTRKKIIDNAFIPVNVSLEKNTFVDRESSHKRFRIRVNSPMKTERKKPSVGNVCVAFTSKSFLDNVCTDNTYTTAKIPSIAPVVCIIAEGTQQGSLISHLLVEDTYKLFYFSRSNRIFLFEV